VQLSSKLFDELVKRVKYQQPSSCISYRVSLKTGAVEWQWQRNITKTPKNLLSINNIRINIANW